MPRSRAKLSIRLESTISALQQSDAAEVQAMVARESEALRLAHIERRVELTDPGFIVGCRRQRKTLHGIAGVHEHQETPFRITALSEPDTQAAQVCVLPLTLLHFGAADVQPRHILDGGVRC